MPNEPAPTDELSADQRFSALVEAFTDRPGVTPPRESGRRGFGSAALKVHGSIFAMLPGDQLVVKLPHARVGALIEAGTGRPFDAGKGTPMKEWLTIVDDAERTWRALTEEAYEFIRSRSRPR